LRPWASREYCASTEEIKSFPKILLSPRESLTSRSYVVLKLGGG